MRIMKNFKEEKLNEASFRAGKASKMIGNIERVLTRRVGTLVAISEVPELYTNNKGTFEGYFGIVGGTKGIRLNFIKSKNDFLKSIDIYNNYLDNKPFLNIDLNGFNIVQVINQIVDVLSGEFERYDEAHTKRRTRIKEKRLSLKDMSAQWLLDNPNYVSDLDKEKFDYEKMVPVFLNYIHTKFNSSKKNITAGALQWNVKEALKDSSFGFNINPKKIASVSVQKPQAVDVSVLSPTLQKLWDEVVNITPKQIMDNLELDVRRIAQDDPLIPGLLIYGKPGTGKTQTVTDVLKEEGIKPVFVDEKVSAYTKFMNIIYQFKTDEVIVFDDNDSVFKDADIIGVLKSVLDMKPVRTINIINPIKVANSDIVIDESFEFDSKVIFLSNLVKMDSAIQSRLGGVMHEINFSKEEMLQLIKENLKGLYAEISTVTDAMRSKVYDFVEEIMPIVNDIDYRAFNYCLSFCHATEKAGLADSAWKKKSMRFLANYKKELVKGKTY
jgi:hypothetical protein